MQTCPDCHNVIEIAKDNPEYQIIDIGAHVRNLKEFLKLRDTTTAFDAAKRYGAIGLPCFVLEDGTVTLSSRRQASHLWRQERHAASTEADADHMQPHDRRQSRHPPIIRMASSFSL